MHATVASKLEGFFKQYPQKDFAKGEMLILQGKKTAQIYYLETGCVKQYDITNRGDEVILNLFKPPAFFPMSLAIHNNESQFIFEAETNVTVRVVPSNDVVAFVQANPDVMFDLLSRVYRGIDGVMGRVAHLMSSTASERLVYELVIEGRRFGQAQADGSCLLIINEKDLAARAGLSRETVSREVSKLKLAGLIQMRRNRICIPDMAALEESP